MNTDTPVVYLMRGLPGSGKSHTARQLVQDGGVVLETDTYFYKEVGDNPDVYDFSVDLLPAAREWLLEQFRQAIARNVSPIVLDRGNGRNPQTRVFAAYAADHNYEVRLVEPDSTWWQELRVLLKYKQYVADELFDHWAAHLAERTRGGHNVPRRTIRGWMSGWRHDLTVSEILNCDPRE